MRVTVQRVSLGPVPTAAVRNAALAALLRRSADLLGVGARSGLALRLTDDAELRRLNHAHAGVDAATDVLAFPGDGHSWIGDIAVSVERAFAQNATDPAAELRLLVVHGLLHCLGHDHADAASSLAMTLATRRLLPDQSVPALP